MKTMIRWAAVVSLAATLPFSAYAAKEEFKAGVIDLHAVMANSKKAQAINEKLQKEFSAREKEVVASEKSFQEKVEKFKKDSAVMAEAERASTEKDLLKLQQELQRKQNEFREDVGNRQRDEMQAFLNELRETIKTYAEKEKFDIIIQSDMVPFANTKLDVTKPLVQALDGK